MGGSIEPSNAQPAATISEEEEGKEAGLLYILGYARPRRIHLVQLQIWEMKSAVEGVFESVLPCRAKRDVMQPTNAAFKG